MLKWTLVIMGKPGVVQCLFSRRPSGRIDLKQALDEINENTIRYVELLLQRRLLRDYVLHFIRVLPSTNHISSSQSYLP